MCLLAGNFQMAAARKIALDLFFANNLLDAVDGLKRRGVHFADDFYAVALDQRRRRKLHPGKHHTAVPRTGAPAESLGFEHGNAHAALRQRARCGESAESRAHNGNVDGIGKLRRGGKSRRIDGGRPVIVFDWRREHSVTSA